MSNLKLVTNNTDTEIRTKSIYPQTIVSINKVYLFGGIKFNIKIEDRKPGIKSHYAKYKTTYKLKIFGKSVFEFITMSEIKPSVWFADHHIKY